MSVRPLISMYLLMLCAVTTGCGPSAAPKDEKKDLAAEKKDAAAERNAATEKRADEKKAAEKGADEKKAPEKKADDGKAAADGYVAVKVEVELRGVLTYEKEGEATIVVKELHGHGLKTRNPWVEERSFVLDFGKDKEMDAKAKEFDGKTVLVEGSAFLRYGQLPVEASRRFDIAGESEGVLALDLCARVTVKNLVAATDRPRD
jgi:hypothetical protein